MQETLAAENERLRAENARLRETLETARDASKALVVCDQLVAARQTPRKREETLRLRAQLARQAAVVEAARRHVDDIRGLPMTRSMIRVVNALAALDSTDQDLTPTRGVVQSVTRPGYDASHLPDADDVLDDPADAGGER